MKILIVNKFLFPNGGSETYIFEIGKQLQKMGHEVQYFGMEHEGRIVGNHAESYTSDMDFHAKGLQKLLYPFKIIYSTEARKKIRQVLDDMKPDIIHLNNFNFQITPSIIYEIRKWERKQKKKVRIIFTAHDYQWVCPNHMMMIPSSKQLCFQCQGGKYGSCVTNRCIHNSRVKSILGMMEAKLYQKLHTYGKVDQVIRPSQFMSDKLSTSPVLKDKLIVLHNFLTEEKYQVVEKKDYILYFGRYSEEKGIHTLLQVCRELSQIPFIFAGGGPLEKELQSCPNITNMGFLQGKKLKELIAEARFTIFPSEWYENCPFTVMESQWYGTPVIASAIGGVPELVQDGKTGILFEAGNAGELKGKIAELWDQKEELQCLTQNCREVSFDSAEEYCRKLEKIYTQGC